jgi:hypothetical protein
MDTRRAIAVWAYMAINKGRHRRDALLNLLCPACDLSHGRAALCRTFSTLCLAFTAPSSDSGQSTWLDVEPFCAHLDAYHTHAYPESAGSYSRQGLGYDRLNKRTRD